MTYTFEEIEPQSQIRFIAMPAGTNIIIRPFPSKFS